MKEYYFYCHQALKIGSFLYLPHNRLFENINELVEFIINDKYFNKYAEKFFRVVKIKQNESIPGSFLIIKILNEEDCYNFKNKLKKLSSLA